MNKKLLLFFVALTTIACTKNVQPTLDYSVFDEAYYYMSTPERDSVWALIPADTLASNEQLARMHASFLREQETAVGCHYTDFAHPMPWGGDLALSNLVGKTDYVLIDFWASWCPPCRELMPRLKELYASLPEGKLEIVGVSLDNDKDRWVGAIEGLDLPWAHMSDLQGWNCAPAATYGIFCIPTLVLIDREGTIVARGCDEEAVLAAIK